jgi:hypothetical protein
MFHIYNDLSSSSSVTNSTFTNITPLYGSTVDGVIYIQSPNGYRSCTIDYCVFSQCEASRGGALYLESNTPFIYISRTRFENNSAFYGDDIYVSNSFCFNNAEGGSGSLDSSVCSITPLDDRLNCGGADTGQLQNTCSKEVV